MELRSFFYISLMLCSLTAVVLGDEELNKIHQKLKDVHFQLNVINEELAVLSSKKLDEPVPEKTSSEAADNVDEPLVDNTSQNKPVDDSDASDDETVNLVPRSTLQDVISKLKDAESRLQEALQKLSPANEANAEDTPAKELKALRRRSSSLQALLRGGK